MSWHYVGALGGDPRLAPNLSAIAEQGILMDHCFSVGQRSAQGLAGTLAGFPDLPGSGVITRPQSEGQFLTLARILGGRGYQTLFAHGGQPDFDHQQAFCASNGYARVVFEDQIPIRTFRNALGWCDEDVFSSVDRLASEMTSRPFFISLYTTSFHRPWVIPPGKIQPVDPGDPHAEELDAAHYADWAIGQFMARARQSSYFDRTIFVFTADHAGGSYGTSTNGTDESPRAPCRLTRKP
jgi:phosphoglycerol transferase MdoB-like AlkP superfamily enzyme